MYCFIHFYLVKQLLLILVIFYFLYFKNTGSDLSVLKKPFTNCFVKRQIPYWPYLIVFVLLSSFCF